MLCQPWYNVKCEYIHNTGHLNHLFQTNLCEYMEYNHIGDWGGGGAYLRRLVLGRGYGWQQTTATDYNNNVCRNVNLIQGYVLYNCQCTLNIHNNGLCLSGKNNSYFICFLGPFSVIQVYIYLQILCNRPNFFNILSFTISYLESFSTK